MMPRLGNKGGPDWWEASALTTAPSLLPICLAANPENKYFGHFFLSEYPIARAFVKFLCRKSVGFFSQAFLVFLKKKVEI